FAAPDVYASEAALERIFPHLKHNARVVAFGAKSSSKPLAKILNSVVPWVFSKFSFPTTPSPDREPWRLLAKRVEKVDVEEYLRGLMFLASATKKGQAT